MEIFKPTQKSARRVKINLRQEKKYVLFSSSFNNPIKNYPLATEAIKLLNNKNVELLELKGCTREEVAILMNAVDLCLMTSFSEGSPQFIKEAMACNCPIVSTDVGDVREVISNTESCYICSYNPGDVAEKIKLALDFGKRTDGREKIRHLDDQIIARKIISVYKNVLMLFPQYSD
jgi:glycosyltransferase involved in cell wall biosynthesis